MSLLLFKKEFCAAIRSGAKTTTLRRWHGRRVTAGRRAFTPGVGWLMIEAVDAIELKSLTEQDASSDGFASTALMLQKLAALYPPDVDDGKQWYRVRFRADELLPLSSDSGSAQPFGDPLFDFSRSKSRGEDLQAP